MDDRGLYHKYSVYRVDESPNHENCDYFVLDLTHDPYARQALAAYAVACADKHPQLAKDLGAKVLEMEKSIAPLKPITQNPPYCDCGGRAVWKECQCNIDTTGLHRVWCHHASTCAWRKYMMTYQK